MTNELIWQHLDQPGWEHVRVQDDHPGWTVFNSIFVRHHNGQVLHTHVKPNENGHGPRPNYQLPASSRAILPTRENPPPGGHCVALQPCADVTDSRRLPHRTHYLMRGLTQRHRSP